MGITEKAYNPQHRKTAAVFALGFDGVLHCWLATFIYVRLRNSRLAAQALARAEMERSEANRKLLDSQLSTAHAVIDPEAVFEKLETIERIYDEDPARADALLDELIVFLRTAIPQLRSDEAAAQNAA
jgi:LytS/YehU family sensor histidine kinase